MHMLPAPKPSPFPYGPPDFGVTIQLVAGCDEAYVDAFGDRAVLTWTRDINDRVVFDSCFGATLDDEVLDDVRAEIDRRDRRQPWSRS